MRHIADIGQRVAHCHDTASGQIGIGFVVAGVLAHIGFAQALCKGFQLRQLGRRFATTNRFAGNVFGLHHRLVTLALEQSYGGLGDGGREAVTLHAGLGDGHRAGHHVKLFRLQTGQHAFPWQCGPFDFDAHFLGHFVHQVRVEAHMIAGIDEVERCESGLCADLQDAGRFGACQRVLRLCAHCQAQCQGYAQKGFQY